jgi:hypothetical protein
MPDIWTDETTFYPPPGSLPADALATSMEDAWEKIEGTLRGMRRLKDGWDGAGAEAPRREVVDSAISFLRELRERGTPRPSRVVASPNGAVVIEWQMDGTYREAEIAEPERVEWMLSQMHRPTRHWQESWPVPFSRGTVCYTKSDYGQGQLVLAY